MTEKKESSFGNYCTNTAKSLTKTDTTALSASKVQDNNCQKCGQLHQSTHNYCTNCGNKKEEISIKSGMKKIDTKLPQFNTTSTSNITSKIDIMYILKSVGIISLIGLSIGIILTLVAFKDVFDFAYQWGIMSNSMIGKVSSGVFSIGIFLWRLVSFIPFDYGFGKLYLIDTLKFIEYGDTIAMGVITLFAFAIVMIYIMFVFGKKLATKHAENYLANALAFSGIYSFVLCMTVGNIFIQAFITAAIVSFVPVFLGCKYIESKNIKTSEVM